MSWTFNPQPGRRERHLARIHRNPLFGHPPPEVDLARLEQAWSGDREDLMDFEGRFRALVEEAAALGAHADTEVVLALKERLEQAYEEAVGLAGDQGRIKEALQRLVDVTMRAVRAAAGNDPLALDELAQEEAARRLHFALLEEPLVADLLAPDGPIPAEDLVPTLLSSPEAALGKVLDLFDREQIVALCAQGRALLEERREQGYPLPEAWLRLGQMEAHRDRQED